MFYVFILPQPHVQVHVKPISQVWKLSSIGWKQMIFQVCGINCGDFLRCWFFKNWGAYLLLQVIKVLEGIFYDDTLLNVVIVGIIFPRHINLFHCNSVVLQIFSLIGGEGHIIGIWCLLFCINMFPSTP